VCVCVNIGMCWLCN